MDEVAGWDDETFLGYVELHSKTERALFHKVHIERLLKLAGVFMFPLEGTWLAVHNDAAQPLVDIARRNKSCPTEVDEKGG